MPRKVVFADEAVYAKIGHTSRKAIGLYVLAKRYRIETGRPQHCSKGDVVIMQQLFSGLSMNHCCIALRKAPYSQEVDASY